MNLFPRDFKYWFKEMFWPETQWLIASLLSPPLIPVSADVSIQHKHLNWFKAEDFYSLFLYMAGWLVYRLELKHRLERSLVLSVFTEGDIPCETDKETWTVHLGPCFIRLLLIY